MAPLTDDNDERADGYGAHTAVSKTARARSVSGPLNTEDTGLDDEKTNRFTEADSDVVGHENVARTSTKKTGDNRERGDADIRHNSTALEHGTSAVPDAMLVSPSENAIVIEGFGRGSMGTVRQHRPDLVDFRGLPLEFHNQQSQGTDRGSLDILEDAAPSYRPIDYREASQVPLPNSETSSKRSVPVDPPPETIYRSVNLSRIWRYVRRTYRYRLADRRKKRRLCSTGLPGPRHQYPHIGKKTRTSLMGRATHRQWMKSPRITARTSSA